MALFLDSSYLIALADPKDPWNAPAKSLREQVDLGRPWHTHALVAAEVVAAVGSRRGGKLAQLVYEVITDDMVLHFPDAVDLDESMGTVRHYDGKLSLADAYAVRVMEQNGLTAVVSFDADFDRAGVTRLGATR